MGVFKKLFFGGETPKDNANSEYLDEAYGSLSDDYTDPDKVYDDVLANAEDTDSYENTTVSYEIGEDNNDSDEGYLEFNSEYDSDAEDMNLSDDLYSEDIENIEDTAVLQSELGDTGELDINQIREEAERVDSYISELETAYDAGNAHDETDGDYDSEDYSDYAPKEIVSNVAHTEYYDLDSSEEDKKEKKQNKFTRFMKKHAKLIATSAAAVLVIVLVVVGSIYVISGGLDPLKGYSQTNAVKGNVIKTMAASGNVEPNARYEITSLVNGTITESPLNAGEAVKSGELIYRIDDTNAELAVQMAENAVERAKVSDSDDDESLSIYANATGTITELNISSGSRISGGQVATITQASGVEIGLVPDVTGTVQSVKVREGASVTKGQVIATLKSSTSSSSTQGQQLDVEGSKIALEQAQKDLEKYKIASPIDGTILVKNAKIGDNVTAGKSDSPLMIIADMSKMKFTIEVDELDIWNIQLGQTVVISAPAMNGETFSGEITNIAGEGEKKGSGLTTYAVEITISDPGKLKSGMNVEAKIIINSAINVVTLPEQALFESDGKNALVITNSVSVKDENIMNPDDYPHITVPDGYNLVKVKYGVNDGTNVEILSGISVGDLVLLSSGESSLREAESISDDDKSDEKSTKSSSSKSSKSSDDEDDDTLDDSDDMDLFSTDDDADSDNVHSTGHSALWDELDV